MVVRRQYWVPTKNAAAMIRFEASLAPVVVLSVPQTREGPDSMRQPPVAALRKEYREDVQGVIQQNLESYSTRFAMELDDLGKDLDHKIQHQGDRLIMYLRGGPHQRIKDKVCISRRIPRN
jgi:hypothetical protein